MSNYSDFFRSSIKRSAESDAPHAYVARILLEWVDDVQSRDVHFGEIYEIVGKCILGSAAGFQLFTWFAVKHDIQMTLNELTKNYENGARVAELHVREHKTIEFSPTVLATYKILDHTDRSKDRLAKRTTNQRRKKNGKKPK